MKHLIFQIISFIFFRKNDFLFCQPLDFDCLINSFERCTVLKAIIFEIKTIRNKLCVTKSSLHLEFFFFWPFLNFCDLFFEKLIIIWQWCDKCIIHKQQIKEKIVSNKSLSAVPNFFKK
jgi:hypothetical protein